MNNGTGFYNASSFKPSGVKFSQQVIMQLKLQLCMVGETILYMGEYNIATSDYLITQLRL